LRPSGRRARELRAPSTMRRASPRRPGAQALTRMAWQRGPVPTRARACASRPPPPASRRPVREGPAVSIMMRPDRTPSARTASAAPRGTPRDRPRRLLREELVDVLHRIDPSRFASAGSRGSRASCVRLFSRPLGEGDPKGGRRCADGGGSPPGVQREVRSVLRLREGAREERSAKHHDVDLQVRE